MELVDLAYINLSVLLQCVLQNSCSLIWSSAMFFLLLGPQTAFVSATRYLTFKCAISFFLLDFSFHNHLQFSGVNYICCLNSLNVWWLLFICICEWRPVHKDSLASKYFLNLRKNSPFPEWYVPVLIIKSRTKGTRTRTNAQYYGLSISSVFLKIRSEQTSSKSWGFGQKTSGPHTQNIPPLNCFHRKLPPFLPSVKS